MWRDIKNALTNLYHIFFSYYLSLLIILLFKSFIILFIII